MPFGNSDWLALTTEDALEPEFPICDPHHHFWDFRTERIPYQRYLLHELAADIKELAPGKPVIMMTGVGDIMEGTGEKPPGVDLVLSKPVPLADLREALLELGA